MGRASCARAGRGAARETNARECPKGCRVIAGPCVAATAFVCAERSSRRQPIMARAHAASRREDVRVLEDRIPMPKPAALAATVVLYRRAPALEVYWVQRADALQFLGGVHAFPGGRVERGDR